jgi:3-deoxy-manno-octulosonate cytidylyltransferase (CMP-KDO synthetase)
MTLPHSENFTKGSAGLKVIIAVPARLGSTRLPRKPLALLAGQPLVVHVARRVTECAARIGRELNLTAQSLITLVATDSAEIQNALEGSGVQTVMTNSELPSGTDRIEAAVEHLEAQGDVFPDSTLVINLQGDEPFFCIDDITRLVQAMQMSADIPMGTLCYAQNSTEHFLRSSVVKVTRDRNRHALCFSRAPFPWPRQIWGASESIPSLVEKMSATKEIEFLQHVGVYAYRRAALKKFTKMPPSRLELYEGLEQLRALEAGWKIIVEDAQDAPFGIDTSDDLQRAEKHLAEVGKPR